MTYLLRWRLQLGARLLQTTNRSVADIAAEVGYESEPGIQPRFPARVWHSTSEVSHRIAEAK